MPFKIKKSSYSKIKGIIQISYGALMKQIFQRFSSIFILICGLFIIGSSSLVLVGLINDGEVNINRLHVDKLYNSYTKLNVLKNKVNLLEKDRKVFAYYEFQTLIPSEKLWIQKLEEIINIPRSQKHYFSSINIFLDSFKESVTNADRLFLQTGKIQKVDMYIDKFDKFLMSKKMSILTKRLDRFSKQWIIYKQDLFQVGIDGLGEWKLHLQNMENTLLASSVKSSLKEQVLEKLYFLREMTNDMNLLFLFSNTYLLKRKDITNQINFVMTGIRYEQENILLKFVRNEYIMKMAFAMMFVISFFLILIGGIKNIRKSFKKADAPLAVLADEIYSSQDLPLTVYEGKDRLRQEVGKVISETLFDIATKNNNSIKSKKKSKRKITRCPEMNN